MDEGAEKLDKDVALVVSGGRTGTAFLGRFVSEIVQGAFSVHEPDVWRGLSWETLVGIRTFGFRHMVVDRLLGRSGFRNLSMQRLSGELTVGQAATEIRRQRTDYYGSLAEPCVLESNYQAYGIVSAFRQAFPGSRIAALVRHPESWVASCIDRGTRRGDRDRVQRWGGRRLSPAMLGDGEYIERWDEMTKYERLCWDWRTINGSLLRQARRDPGVRMFRYEDLFLSADREESFRDFLDFVTRFPDARYEYSFDPEILGRRINVRPGRQSHDGRQPEPRIESLREICGETMRRLGYEEGTLSSGRACE